MGFIAPFSDFRRKLGNYHLISLAFCLMLAAILGFGLYYFLTRRQIGAEIFLAPETAGLLCGGLVLCLTLLLREMMLRHRLEREMRRQMAILSNNLARLTRRVGLEPLGEHGHGEASLVTIIAEMREMRSMILALYGTRGGKEAALKPKSEAQFGAEPLGFDVPLKKSPSPSSKSPHLGGKFSSNLHNNAPAHAPSQEVPTFLRAGKTDRVVNLSEDNGSNLSPRPGLENVSLEPIMAAANALANPLDSAAEAIRAALAKDQMQIYLEPILSLPHRRLAFSRVSSHITLEDGQNLSPMNYQDVARESGLLGAIDNLALVRAVQRIRRMRRGRQVTPLFCPMSGDTLRERELFNDFRVFLRNNAELASHLIFSFTQYDLERLDPRTEADLIELNRFGFRYSVSQVTSLDIFAADYGRRGIKFVEVAASFLLQAFPAIGRSNAVKKLLDPGGLDLIATEIEDEENLLDMLDYNIDFGSGAVFGLPRPSSDDE